MATKIFSDLFSRSDRKLGPRRAADRSVPPVEADQSPAEPAPAETAPKPAPELPPATLRGAERALPDEAQLRRRKLTRALIRCGIYLANADGEVVKNEIETLTNFFANESGSFHGEETQTTRRLEAELLANAVSNPPSLEDAQREIRGLTRGDQELVMDCLHRVVVADARVEVEEIEALDQLAEAMDWESVMLDQVHSRYISQDSSGFKAARGPFTNTSINSTRGSFRVLGLPQGANLEEVTRAYTSLKAQYAPELFEQTGPFHKAAVERWRPLEDAYQVLKALFSSDA